MKRGELSPVYKKSDNLIKNNFRPVSVLTTISKVYESVMNDQMYDFFNLIFESLLAAFRKGYSCQSLLVKFIDDIKKSVDQGDIVGTVFMDLSKAFDCLPHSLLIAKLNAYGLSMSACELLSSYLSERYQRVKVANSRSEWKSLVKGVPQGSILGPLLFNVFMNDLFYFIERCNLYNYADDNSLSKAARTLVKVIQDLKYDSKITIQWMSDNGMQANPSKFQFMLISSTELGEVEIEIDENTIIKSEPSVKALGVIIDNKLKFSEHVSACCKKGARQLNALTRIAKYLEPSANTILYNSFVKSNFNYCPLVWHFCGKVNNDKLEKIQERSLRILSKDYDSSYDELLHQFSTTTLHVSRLKNILTEVFKTIKGLNPECLNSLFEIKHTNYSMRNNYIINQPKRNTTTFGLRSISYMGAKLWNDLPHHRLDFIDMSVIEFKRYLVSWEPSNMLISSFNYI